VAILLLCDRGQLRTDCWTVNAGAAEGFVGIVAGFRDLIQSSHSIVVGTAWLCLKVDLEWTSQELFIAKELQKLCVVLCPSTNEINSFATRCAVFHIFATVVKSTLVFFRPEVLQFCDYSLSRCGFRGFCDVHEERLIGRAGKGAEQVKEVLLASWAGCDYAFGELEV